ncbi:hypothetical protein WJX82_008495 [Trebouxia sp. C0006]
MDRVAPRNRVAGVKHTDNAALTYSGYRDVLQGSGETFTNLNPTGALKTWQMTMACHIAVVLRTGLSSGREAQCGARIRWESFVTGFLRISCRPRV